MAIHCRAVKNSLRGTASNTCGLDSRTHKFHLCRPIQSVTKLFEQCVFEQLGTVLRLKCVCYCIGHLQREGMGLLEYQTLSSLCDVAPDGWLCTFNM